MEPMAGIKSATNGFETVALPLNYIGLKTVNHRIDASLIYDPPWFGR